MKHKITAPGDFVWEGDQLFVYVDEDEIEKGNGVWSVFIDSDVMEPARMLTPAGGCNGVVVVTKSRRLAADCAVTMAGGSCRMMGRGALH